jgi:hypothetical protein
VHSAVGRTSSTIVTTVLLYARWFRLGCRSA